LHLSLLQVRNEVQLGLEVPGSGFTLEGVSVREEKSRPCLDVNCDVGGEGRESNPTKGINAVKVSRKITDFHSGAKPQPNLGISPAKTRLPGGGQALRPQRSEKNGENHL